MRSSSRSRRSAAYAVRVSHVQLVRRIASRRALHRRANNLVAARATRLIEIDVRATAFASEDVLGAREVSSAPGVNTDTPHRRHRVIQALTGRKTIPDLSAPRIAVSASDRFDRPNALFKRFPDNFFGHYIRKTSFWRVNLGHTAVIAGVSLEI